MKHQSISSIRVDGDTSQVDGDTSQKEIFGLGRSRSSVGKGEIIGYHLNPYTNCVHTLAGGGWKTMEILVVEVYA